MKQNIPEFRQVAKSIVNECQNHRNTVSESVLDMKVCVIRKTHTNKASLAERTSTLYPGLKNIKILGVFDLNHIALIFLFYV